MDLKRLIVAGLTAGVALSSFSGEIVAKMEKTPEAVKKYDKYNQKNTDIVKVDDEDKFHIFSAGPVIIPLDPAALGGKKIKMSAVFKYKNIPDVPAGQNPSVFGFKIFINGTTAEGKYWGIQMGPYRGTADWKGAERTFTVPEGMKGLQIQIGMPKGEGAEAWIDELTLETL